jgi:hypothetical protein
MVEGDTNGADDVFLRDLANEYTWRVSLASTGAQANGGSFEPAISADAGVVAFRSSASNLVSGDTNGVDDIFVQDNTTETTTRVSVDGVGTQANSSSSSPAVSSDGRYVAFRSSASNLVSGDTNGVDDIFVRDRTTGTTTRVSVGASAAQANGASSAPAIAGNGGTVAFESSASNLISSDTNSASDVFVRNVAGAYTTRVSVRSGGGQASGTSRFPSISSDGTRVAFQSTAALDGRDSNRASDIYVHDRSAGTTTWASGWAANQGWTTGGASTSPSISGDGRYVALVLHSDVHVQDVNRAPDIYEYDLFAGQWGFISADEVLGPGNKASDAPSISSNGLHTAFASEATNFDADANGAQDTFVHTWLASPADRLASETPELPGDGLSDQAAGEGATEQAVEGATNGTVPGHCSLGKPATPSDVLSEASATDDSPTAVPLLVETPHSCKVQRGSRPNRKPERMPDPFPLPPLPDEKEREQEHRMHFTLQEASDTLATEPLTRPYSIRVSEATVALQNLYWTVKNNPKKPKKLPFPWKKGHAKTQSFRSRSMSLKPNWRDTRQPEGSAVAKTSRERPFLWGRGISGLTPLTTRGAIWCTRRRFRQ